MKKILLFIGAAISFHIATAQEDVTVSVAENYANQTWYHLTDDQTTSAALSSWDIAFEMQGFTASILVNSAKGNVLYIYPSAVANDENFLAMDTASYTNWPQSYNSDTSWSYGAFNRSFANEYDLGWGIYDPVTHFVNGDSLYLLSLADGTFKKLWIKSLAAGVYAFRYANPDNSDDMTTELVKSDFNGKNFGYYSFMDNSTVDPEPLSAEWDLLFTKYTTMIPMPELTPYSVTGVLSNYNVTIAEAVGVDINSDDYEGYSFATEINTIGYDWKEYDFATNTYLIAENLAYFVERANGEIWKIIMTGFGGSATGDFEFTKEQLTTVTAVDNNGIHTAGLSLYPTITSDHTTLVFSNRQYIAHAVITITDMRGDVVELIEQNDMASGIHQQVISLNNYAPGMYFVSVRFNGQQLTQQVIVQ